MTQTWHDLLFAHWPVDASILKQVVPAELQLDSFDGQCWVGVVPFWMSHVCMRGMPPIPGASQFPELNVRTYVVREGKPGVHFFSLDAASSLAVWAARTFYHLPYFRARMKSVASCNEISYESVRVPGNQAEFRGRYSPTGDVRLCSKGTLEHWLSERYCLYTVNRGCVYRAEIHHQQWPLQNAAAEIEMNSMASAAGIALPSCAPLLHFSKKLEVLIWPLRRIAT